jgi:hypothetical protein
MSGGYRGIIFALVGVASLGAAEPPKHGTQAQQATKQREPASGAKPTRTEQSQEPDKSTEPCKAGEDKRYSDLCAQWKAADAAANGAEAGWLQVWIGIGGVAVGLFTLIAAGAAALFAKRAVDETRESNAIAKNTAHLEGRPWLAVSFEVSEPAYLSETFLRVMFRAKIRNVGQSPAKGAHIAIEIYNALEEHGPVPREFLDKHFSETQNHNSNGLVLVPNEESVRQMFLDLPYERFHHKEGALPSAVPIIAISATYGATTDASLTAQTSKGFLLYRKATNGFKSPFRVGVGYTDPKQIAISEAYGFGRAT